MSSDAWISADSRQQQQQPLRELSATPLPLQGE